MEDGLVHARTYTHVCLYKKVLILIVMEDGLVHLLN